jgi:hypothetical protein
VIHDPEINTQLDFTIFFLTTTRFATQDECFVGAMILAYLGFKERIRGAYLGFIFLSLCLNG